MKFHGAFYVGFKTITLSILRGFRIPEKTIEVVTIDSTAT